MRRRKMRSSDASAMKRKRPKRSLEVTSSQLNSPRDRSGLAIRLRCLRAFGSHHTWPFLLRCSHFANRSARSRNSPRSRSAPHPTLGALNDNGLAKSGREQTSSSVHGRSGAAWRDLKDFVPKTDPSRLPWDEFRSGGPVAGITEHRSRLAPKKWLDAAAMTRLSW